MDEAPHNHIFLCSPSLSRRYLTRKMIDLARKQRIILLSLGGTSGRGIARQLHMSKDTVSKYLHAYEQRRTELIAGKHTADSSVLIRDFVEKPTYDSSKRHPLPRTEVARGIIEECLRDNKEKRATGRRKQQMKKVDIHAFLRSKGIRISYSTVKRLVAEIERAHQEAYIRQEYDLGDVCEFDWGDVVLDIAGSGYRRYQMAVFTPAASNHRFALLFMRQDTAAFEEAHASYFAFCHGVFHTMVYDNMRVAVGHFVGSTEKEPTEALLSLSLHYGFAFRFCNVASGNEKGHVERSVEFVRRKAFSEPGRDCFPSLEAANEYLSEKCTELNSQPIYDGSIPTETFEQERASLLPPVPKFDACRVASYHVDKYSTVCIDHNHYSVPDTLVDTTVQVRIYTDKIVVTSSGSPVAQHPRCYDKSHWCLDIYHYLRTLQRKPGALPHSTAFLQADPRLRQLFHSRYSSDPKSFLALLAEKGPAVLEELSEDDITSDPPDT